jgi:hypothetical protein
MKVTGLDHKEYRWSYERYKGRDKCSKYHKRARILLAQMFPFDLVYEEVPLPGSKTERQSRSLVADFWIPQRSLIIEVQGEQHYKFNNHFFDNKIEFFKAQSCDRNKQEWCDINNIVLVQLPYHEQNDQWQKRIEDKL